MRLVSTLLGLAAAILPTVSAAAGKRCFPDDFLIGSATASYQVEGAVNETGRTSSIWDDFCRERDGIQCANVADDMVHRFPSDIQLMKDMGFTSFRFSISWSRVMTWNNATQQMVRNDPGIAFYHKLLNAVIAANIKPVVTLYHWDLPSALNKVQNGWLNASMIDHFNTYASLMFDEFGDKIPYWATFNEPWSFCQIGYGFGTHAPGISNSANASYVCAHNVLRSHAAAVSTFRKKGLKSKISIALNCDAAIPLDPTSEADKAAADRQMQFYLGWFLSPIVTGDYPPIMRKRANARLPNFTTAEAALLKGSYDLFMLNHYSSNAVTDCASNQSRVSCTGGPDGWAKDVGVDNGRFPVGARKGSVDAKGNALCSWFNGYPEGYLVVMRWMHAHDKSAKIMLTENGWCGNSVVDNQDQLWYYQTYLDQVWQAIKEGIPIIGYTAWSLVDNYEWGSFEPRFGIFHVEFPENIGSKDFYTPVTDLVRTARPAAIWLGLLAKNKGLCFPGDTYSAWLYVGIVVPTLLVVGAVAFFVYRKRQQRAAAGAGAFVMSPDMPKEVLSGKGGTSPSEIIYELSTPAK
ncbi:Aste57867_19932 [Aphanomyces stellatus]|uniref:Aste57867_19932 protein n=1 Tax=Aphanomyces stellatus TaxID=120398 RepID=A0A485LF07_9STRA|nr:hypothetical protein As57867_019866 [Aphanomyces stellatus]VFT96630.1 Aste57867_19932 [Aphanomyces stellatus]